MYLTKALRQRLKEKLLKESVEENPTDDIKVEVDGEVVVDTQSDADVDTHETAVVNDAEPVSENEPDPIETPGPALGLSDLLITAINDEYEAINEYNSLIATANDGGFSNIADILKHINEEENIHVGMLQYALTLISKQASEVETGTEEAAEIVSGEGDPHNEH